MAYSYPYNYQYPQYGQNYNAQQNAGSIIWVQGEAGAKSYLVAPNTTVQLWDSEAQVIYLKSADASGMPSMKILDYKIRDNAQPSSAPVIKNDYVTHDELAALENKIRNQIAKIGKENTDGESVV